MRLVNADAIYYKDGKMVLPKVDAVPLEDYKSMESTVNKLTQALANSEKHGHWLFYEEPDGYYHSECSECGQWCDEDVFLKGKWHYCPNCGAKMDEVDNGDNT